MRIRLTMLAAGDRCDVVLDAPAGTTVAGLRATVATELGGPVDVAWWAGRRLLPDTALLGGPGLRAGDEVTLGATAAGPEAEPAPLHLAVTGGPGAGGMLPLGRGVHLIGRSDVCDLQLPDAEVSRRHAEVTVTTAGVSVRDLDSRNGTTRSGEVVDRDGDDLGPGDELRIGPNTVVLRSDLGTPVPVRPAGDGRVLVLRPAHERPARADRTLTAPTPPPDHERPRIAWIAAFVPAVAAVGLAWFLHTWQFLAFAALTPVTLLGTAAGDRWSWRSGRRRAAAEHAAATLEFGRRRADLLTAERRDRLDLHPDPPRCARAAQGPAAPLWQRRPGDPRGLHVRLGTAERPSRTAVVTAAGETSPAGRLGDLPVCADLELGPLGVAGPDEHARATAAGVLAQLAVAHPPGDVEFVVLLSDATDTAWDWLRWLPHRVRRAATTRDRTAVLTELAQRCRGTAGTSMRPPGARTIVLADRAGALADHHELDEVLEFGAAAGIHAVCVERTANALPGTCVSSAVIHGSTHALLALGGHGWDTADGTPDVTEPVVADQVDAAWCTRLARALAPLDDGATADGDLPRQVRLRDLLAVEDADAIAAAWAVGADVTTPLRAVVGVDATGPAALDLGADGPHALVAGTTGAGKSELLQTWIASLAVAHAPDDVGFLLVDYKGGAAFGACARLPHTLGLVTDLDRHLTGRVLQSLEAEIRRRERLLAEVGAADLTAYRRARAGERLARLVVVVDEFATLAADLPDFVPGLVDIAQRGRSLGLHLVLATQRPGHAVSPAIRANTTLRIALRVTDPGESGDVIGVVDAAGLDPGCPGRAVVRTGHGLSTLQTARVTAPVRSGRTTVRVWRVGPWDEPPPAPVPEGQRTDLDDLVDLLDKAWARRFADGATAPRPTWLPPLPAELSVSDLVAADDLASAADPGLRPVIGLRDQPGRQRQVAERLDLATGGTLLVPGAARSGRTGLLRTVAYAAAALGVPTVVLDGDGLGALRSLATTVAYVTADDGDAVVRLVDLLEQEYAARRGAPDPPARPPLVVLVDAWPAFVVALDEVAGGRTTDRMLGLWRGAGSAGVTVVATGDRSVLATRTASAADRILLLRPADPADALMAGLTARDLPDAMPPGRAVAAPEGDIVQLVRAGAPPTGVRPRPTLTGLRLKALPDRAVLPTGVEGAPTGLRLGLGGDGAGTVEVDPWAGGGRWLVAGPPRSGRSTTLTRLALEAGRAGADVRWWAPPNSPLAVAGGTDGWSRLDAGATALASTGPARCLVLLDDVDALADAPLSEAIAAALRTATPGRLAVVCAGRPDELLMSYRGAVAEVRRARRGLLLRPGAGDGELVGIRTGRVRAETPPGRGVLVADGVRVGGFPVDVGALPVQVAEPPAPPDGRGPS